MVYRKFKINKISQSYLFVLKNKYKNISSGRKNYSFQYKRVLKNILLSKIYTKNKTLENKKHYRLNLTN